MTSLRILFRDLSWLRILSKAQRLPCNERGPASGLAQGGPEDPTDPRSLPSARPGTQSSLAGRCQRGQPHACSQLRPLPCGHSQGGDHVAGAPCSTSARGTQRFPQRLCQAAWHAKECPAAHSSLSLSLLFILSNKGSVKGTWNEFSSASREAALHTSNQKVPFATDKHNTHILSAWTQSLICQRFKAVWWEICLFWCI